MHPWFIFLVIDRILFEMTKKVWSIRSLCLKRYPCDYCYGEFSKQRKPLCIIFAKYLPKIL